MAEARWPIARPIREFIESVFRLLRAFRHD
jgi:hypothetical protein